MRGLCTAVLALGALMLGVAVPARADSIALKSGNTHQPVRIRDVKDGDLVYRTSSGRERFVRLNEVQRIEVAGMDSLNDAEATFDNGEYMAAIVQYEKVLADSPSVWTLHWSRYRLLRAYDALGEFAKCVEQFCALVEVMPGAATQLSPTQWPEPESTFYQDALALLGRAAGNARDHAVRQAIQDLSTRVQHKIRSAVKPDTSEVLDDIGDLIGVEPEGDEKVEVQDRRLELIQEALERRAYPKVVELADEVLDENASDEESAWALLWRGQALLSYARNRDQYFDSGLSLMRVVIHLPDSGAAPQAGYYAGLAMERADEPQAAIALWQEALPKAADDEALTRKITQSLQRVTRRPVPNGSDSPSPGA